MDPGALDLALVVFAHTEGAERAYSTAPGDVNGVRWASEVAFVEHHGHDRIVVRGEFAGRYVDADDRQDFIGRKTVEGALTGALAGAVFGPPGFAAGMVGGGLAGSVAEENSGPQLRSAFFDEVRNDVPEGSSAVILLAAPEHVDAMVAALEGKVDASCARGSRQRPLRPSRPQSPAIRRRPLRARLLEADQVPVAMTKASHRCDAGRYSRAIIAIASRSRST